MTDRRNVYDASVDVALIPIGGAMTMPYGMHPEWVAEPSTGRRGWRVATADEAATRRCRAFDPGPPRAGCGGRPVAAYNRGLQRFGSRERDCWWLYCEHHLNGRIVHGDVVRVLKLVPDG